MHTIYHHRDRPETEHHAAGELLVGERRDPARTLGEVGVGGVQRRSARTPARARAASRRRASRSCNRRRAPMSAALGAAARRSPEPTAGSRTPGTRCARGRGRAMLRSVEVIRGRECARATRLMLKASQAPSGRPSPRPAARAGAHAGERATVRAMVRRQLSGSGRHIDIHGAPSHDQRGGDREQQHVLEHVDPEQLLRERVDRAHERDQDRRQAGVERGRPPARSPVTRAPGDDLRAALAHQMKRERRQRQRDWEIAQPRDLSRRGGSRRSAPYQSASTTNTSNERQHQRQHAR